MSQRATLNRVTFLVSLFLLLASSCTGSSSSEDAETSSPSSAPVTLPATTTSDPTPSSSPTKVDNTGVIGIGPDYAVSIDYLALVEQYWLLSVGSVERVQDDMVLIDVTFEYLGDSQAGKLLDLVVELETPSGTIDPLQTPCSPLPKKALDLFGSVKIDEPQSGLLCFPTAEDPTAVVITPLIDDPIRIEIATS